MAKTKLAVVVRDDLATWQRLNVATFVVSGIGTRHPEVMGETYQDASGAGYLAKFILPVLVYEAGGEEIRVAHRIAADRGLTVDVYIEEMFLTTNDVDNRAAVAAVPTDKLALVGIAVYGNRNAVDKALKGLRLHP